jgi:ribonuclease P protein component
VGTAHQSIVWKGGRCPPYARVANQFPKRVRLLRASEFERVFAARVSVADTSMVLHGAANELGRPRLGLVVSRRIGGAVERNRWKRLLREAFRLTQDQLPPLDLICIPRPGGPASLEVLKASLLRLAARVERKASDSIRRSSEKAT